MIALMFGALTASANEGKLDLTNGSTSKSVVYKMDSSARATTIKFVDVYGTIIYSEQIENMDYSKEFSLKDLEDGVYYFINEDALKKVTYTMRIANSEVTILEKKEEIKPVFKQKEGMVYLNFLNRDKSPVSIEIIDSNNRSIFTEKLDNEFMVKKAFNFKKAFKDEYTIVVKDGGKAFYESISIN